jgi:hypothetical protein
VLAQAAELPGMVRAGATVADAVAERLRYAEHDRAVKPSPSRTSATEPAPAPRCAVSDLRRARLPLHVALVTDQDGKHKPTHPPQPHHRPNNRLTLPLIPATERGHHHDKRRFALRIAPVLLHPVGVRRVGWISLDRGVQGVVRGRILRDVAWIAARGLGESSRGLPSRGIRVV